MRQVTVQVFKISQPVNATGDEAGYRFKFSKFHNQLMQLAMRQVTGSSFQNFTASNSNWQ
jgi:hypothetical protein